MAKITRQFLDDLEIGVRDETLGDLMLEAWSYNQKMTDITLDQLAAAINAEVEREEEDA